MEDIITSELASENGHVKCPQCEAALSAKPTNMYPVSCTECRGTLTYEQVGVSPWRVFSGYIVHGLVISIFIDLYTQWLTLLQQSLVLLAIALVSYVLWSVFYKKTAQYLYRYSFPLNEVVQWRRQHDFQQYLQYCIDNPADMIGQVRVLLNRFREFLQPHPDILAQLQQIAQRSEHLPSLQQQSDWREAHLATDLAMVAQLQHDFANRFQQACSRLYKSECNIL